MLHCALEKHFIIFILLSFYCSVILFILFIRIYTFSTQYKYFCDWTLSACSSNARRKITFPEEET